MAGRVIVLLLLIIVLAAGGLVWFDYLNVIDAKTILAPVYKYLPFLSGPGRSKPKISPDIPINLDAERLAVRLEALDLQNLELNSMRAALTRRSGEIEQMAQELEERQKALEDLENSLKAQQLDAENKDRNVEQQARYLTGMPPERAVGILNRMADQDAIDILRKTEDIAKADGTSSVVAYWLSLMDPQRAAELQRKMASRPNL